VSATATEMVAVLMTDLEGSTAMADRLGPSAADELRLEHFALLRGALERTGGREVKNLGDGLMVVFDGAAQSLACAAQMQQVVEARNRRAEEKLGLRIGVSVGDTTVEEGDYFGEPVVEAARLCARAAGGQIIVTDLVYRLGGSRDSHVFESLGDLELKGISAPVQAFELRWEPAAVQGTMPLPERLRELPATAYVGRQSERERMGQLWDQTRDGSLRVALISGEAGVGKTRLSTHLALAAHGEGATVLFGRCDEDLGVPYQPWAQALGYLVEQAAQPLLDAHVERFGGDIARLVPSLSDRAAELPAPRQSDPETERYLMYAAVTGLLEGAGEKEPLLIILDDLHWADAPTLSLLHHVVASGTSMRVMVVGTYRDSDLSREHRLTSLLADLRREQGVERVKLEGLGVEDVVALMEAAAGQQMDEVGRALAEEITLETAGNPFFAGELLLHLTESGAIVQSDDGRWRLAAELSELGLPESVREVIGRRVERLGADARTALSAAAVIGREFELDLLLAVVDLSEDRLLDLLEEAVAASLLNESAEHGGRFTFTHGLVEHTLYEDLGSTRRARLHKRVGEALEVQCGEEPGERLGELAGHWAAAVVSADAAKAIHYARRAAERALEQLAPDEAARWYGKALELHDQASGRGRSERCELLIGLGEAQLQVGNREFRETLLEATHLAQELADADRLCRAVLANSRGYWSQVGTVDGERVEALEAAEQALPDDDRRRARVIAMLASELHYAGEPERCRALAAEAIEIARAAGDPETLTYTLSYASGAISAPDTVTERIRLNGELVELAHGLDDPWFTYVLAVVAVELGHITGDRSQIESGIATVRTVGASVAHPTFAWLRPWAESARALVQGDLQAAEKWALTGFEVGRASGQPDAGSVFGGLQFSVRHMQGRCGELVEQLERFAGSADEISVSRAMWALALLENGRVAEAHELAVAEDPASVPWDLMWSVTVFLWADACSRLGLLDRAAELYERLAPFSDQLAVSGSMVSGSIPFQLGNLASTLGRYEEAEAHFGAAAGIEERLGAPLLLARTHVSWARALIARGRPEDLDRAKHMLEQAEQPAERLGGGLVTREVAECRAALAATHA
jgi:class 3 adenylate cyclase/tetratricopeptide (TPR) repeat protein